MKSRFGYDILYGTCLGDGNLSPPRGASHKSRLRNIAAADEGFAYLRWKQTWLPFKTAVVTRLQSGTGRFYHHLESASEEMLYFLRPCFYGDRGRRLPWKLLDLLGPLALLTWIGDDGSGTSCPAVMLSVGNRYPRGEAARFLQQWLERLKLPARIKEDMHGPERLYTRLYLPVATMRGLVALCPQEIGPLPGLITRKLTGPGPCPIALRRLSHSLRLPQLSSDTSRLCFTWALAHQDDFGWITAHPASLHAAATPYLSHITPEMVESFLTEWQKAGLMDVTSTREGNWMQLRPSDLDQPAPEPPTRRRRPAPTRVATLRRGAA